MKKIITIILVFVASASIAQDTVLFNFINQYRVKHGKKSIVWSSELAKIAEAQTSYNVANNTLEHSKTNTYENINNGSVSFTTKMNPMLTKFAAFIKNTFNVIYKAPTTEVEAKKMAAMYSVFIWNGSPDHKANMLRDNVNKGAVNIFVNVGYDKVFKCFTVYFNSTLNLN